MGSAAERCVQSGAALIRISLRDLTAGSHHYPAHLECLIVSMNSARSGGVIGRLSEALSEVSKSHELKVEAEMNTIGDQHNWAVGRSLVCAD